MNLKILNNNDCKKSYLDMQTKLTSKKCKIPNMKINERIKSKRKELKLTQSDVAKSIKVSRVSITQWELGDTSPNGENLNKLSKVLQTSVDWLLYGKINTENTTRMNSYPNNKKVPLINWVQAGSWAEIADSFQPDDTENSYPCPEKHSDNTFALSVIGESMYPEYKSGEIIYVDPCKEAISGSDVVVMQNGDTEATFKQLVIDGNKKYLKALNPNWPNPIMEMLHDASICGVVIGSYRKRN
jgi:SOS-response transcriptional repressor LexA